MAFHRAYMDIMFYYALFDGNILICELYLSLYIYSYFS